MSTAKERLYRTIDGDVVLEGDPNAAFLLAAVGDEIPEGYSAPRKAADKSADKAESAPANKAAAKPADK